MKCQVTQKARLLRSLLSPGTRDHIHSASSRLASPISDGAGTGMTGKLSGPRNVRRMATVRDGAAHKDSD